MFEVTSSRSRPFGRTRGPRRPRSSPNTLRTRFAVSEPFPRREVASTAPEHVEVHHRVRAPSDGLGGHEGRCYPRTPFARGSPSPSRSRGGRWLRPRRSTLRYIIAVAPLRTDSGPRRPLLSPNTLRTRFTVSDRSRGERALRPRRRLPSDIIASAPLRTDSGPRRPRSSPNTLRTRFTVSEPFPRREVASSAPEHVEVHHRGRAPSDGLGGHEGHGHPRTPFVRGSPSPSRSRGGRWLRPRRSTLRYIIAVAPLRTDSGATKATVIPEHPTHAVRRLRPFPRRKGTSSAPEAAERHHRVRAPSDGLGATKATVIPEHPTHAVHRLRPFPRRKGTSSAPEAAERHHRVRAPSDGLGATKAAVIPEHPSHAVRRLRAVPAAGGGFVRAGAR